MLSKQNLIKGVVVFLIAAVAASLVVTADHFLVPKKSSAIIVMDTAVVVTAKQMWFTKELTKPGVTDDDRKRVYEQTKQFAVDLDRELTKMQADCQCTIFDKGAVILGNYVEITDELKKRLHL